jgi:hypothetical protein
MAIMTELRQRSGLGWLYLALVLGLVCWTPTFASGQGLSRWVLGRPGALIDLPGSPSAGGVKWAERSAYSFLPTSWSAETGGCRIEVARIYGGGSPTQTLGSIGKKLGAASGVQNKGEISGRPFVGYRDNARMIVVAGPDASTPYGTTWAFVAFYNEGGAAIADRVFDSIVIEREGRENWTLRSLGRTQLAAELPFELAPEKRVNDAETTTRYELHFNGLDIRVTQQEQGIGGRFDVEKTIQGIVADRRAAAGVAEFVSSRAKTRLGEKQDADLLTMTFRQGSRAYKILETIAVSGSSAVMTTITTDPNRADQANIADRIFNTLRFTGATIYGWKPYAIGDTGLYLDLPKPPDPPKVSATITTTGVYTGPMAVDVREITYGGTNYDPDKASAQLLNFVNAAHADSQGTIEKRLVDGCEARLLRTTYRNAGFFNHRDVLVIYGADRFWTIDSVAAENEKDYLERIINSARIQLPVNGNLKRQYFGKTGVSFIAGMDAIKTQSKDTPNDPDIVHEENGLVQHEGGFIAFLEDTTKTRTPLIDDKTLTQFAQSFLDGLGESIKVKLTATLRNSYAINVDGLDGRHVLYEVSAPGTNKTILADFVVLVQDRRFWSVMVVSDMQNDQARAMRARILNTIRAGQ